MEYIFLELEEVIEIHSRMIELFGGESGIRDEGLLQSAIAQPSAGFGDEYFHKDLYEMAAAYVFHIVKNHPFIDGNKRVGWMAGIMFLEYNGIIVDPDAQVFHAEIMTLSVAEGKADKQMIAEFFRKYSTVG